jgi:signal transduction histidine kinase
MSITGRIRRFQVVLVLAVVALAATAFLSVRAANHHLERVQVSRLQVEAMAELAIRANRFSEQIAELLLIGEPERAEFDDARAQMASQLEELRRISSREVALVGDPKNDPDEQTEAVWLRRMRMLVREIDRAVERVLLLEQQGSSDEAIALFRSEIENRLDKEFETLIAAKMKAAREDVAGADASARKLLSAVMIGSFLVLGVLLAVVLVAGFLLSRSLRQPIEALVEGTRAIEQGDLAHRINYAKPDEFGVLAGRFNAMSATLSQQRGDLLAARDNFEHQVGERTREIAEANMQLTELDRQRVRFLSDIGHELKTPLTVLRAEAEVALRGASKPEFAYRSALENIVVQSADMGDLIDDLLFLARSDADNIRFEFRPVSLDGAVAQAVQDASLLSDARSIHIVYDCPTPSPIVRADPRRLKQALLVMLDNAARYADAGSEVRVAVEPGVEGRVDICVRDRGPGIPANEVALVFERFYRGSRALEGSVGSGLGLPIARWIVEKHDGKVDLSSTPGVGTEVRVSLPLAA